MSEHVLCMVLYLVELGLDNHAQEDEEDEVSDSSAAAFFFSLTFFQSSGYSCSLHEVHVFLFS